MSYGQIAPGTRHAIIAIEDSRFYRHGAFDLRGTLRALVNDLEHNPVQGGSTLAQQYVKNALILTGAPVNVATAETPARKIRELRMAAIVEHQLTKNQLLTAYLNAAYFENGAYGIQVAAERYFHTSAKKLTLPQGALLAGIVQDPVLYDPVIHKRYARQRRNTVLKRMRQLGYITAAQQQAADLAPLGLNLSTTALQSGCSSRSARHAAFFCEYVLAVMKDDPAYADAYKTLNTVGGLKIYTTMDAGDQRAAEHAVTYMVPPPPSPFNPGRNAAAEVLIQPRTGKVRAIAVDRRYGNDKAAGRDNIDYAVDSRYDGGVGVQTGSSNKIFTLLTALKLGYPFGYHLKIVSPSTLTGYTNCKGEQTSPFMVSNAEGPGAGIYSLYTGTTDSINVFYATLERSVGLCSVVRTAASLGDHRADGRSLFQAAGNPAITGQYRADDLPSFTLGSVNVSPMTMAAAYATVAARGIYCLAYRHLADHNGHRRPAAGEVRPLSPGDLHCGRGRRQPHLPGRDAKRDRCTRPDPRPAHGREDRDGEQCPVRRIRRLHSAPGRVRVDVQSGRPGYPPDDRHRFLLPGRSQRRGRAGLPWVRIRCQCGSDLAVHLRARQPRPLDCLLRVRAAQQPVLLRGQRDNLTRATEAKDLTSTTEAEDLTSTTEEASERQRGLAPLALSRPPSGAGP